MGGVCVLAEHEGQALGDEMIPLPFNLRASIQSSLVFWEQ